MDNKDWDSYLQQILGDFKPEVNPHWEDFTEKLDDAPMNLDNASLPTDDVLRDSLAEYKPNGEVQGWEAIASSLDEADRVFDTGVADKVKYYEAPHDPHAWSSFLKHFSVYKAMRFKLIAIKVIEASAVLLLLFTVFQLNQKGSFKLFASEGNTEDGIQSSENALANQFTGDITKVPSSYLNENHKDDLISTSTSTNHTSTKADGNSTTDRDQPLSTASSATTFIPIASLPVITFNETKVFSPVSKNSLSALSSIAVMSSLRAIAPSDHQQAYITESLSLTNVNVKASTTSASLIPYPVFVKPLDKGHLEFGMLAQMDFNTMKMPQDILYTNRKQFIFPLQGIPSVGYGAGFTLAVAHAHWAFESGVIYNAKTFKPGRSLTVGEGTDNSNVEFEAMQIQLISMPFQFRYKISPKKRIRAYAIAGFGMHIIAQSDIDIDVDYNFNSLPAGENPNNHPALAQTIRESQRLSENFRHKAPFSTKSFVSANLGLGFEYAVAERKTLFLQSTYQYQIPNLRFSNHNGKHLVSTSIQAGVRTPLSF